MRNELRDESLEIRGPNSEAKIEAAHRSDPTRGLIGPTDQTNLRIEDRHRFGLADPEHFKYVPLVLIEYHTRMEPRNDANPISIYCHVRNIHYISYIIAAAA